MNISEWNQIVHDLPQPHLLQSGEWAAFKANYGWEPTPLIWVPEGNGYSFLRGEEVFQNKDKVSAAAMLLERKLPLGLSVMYVPKGPLLDDWQDRSLRKQVISDLVHTAQQVGAILIKIDPDVPLGSGVPGKQEAKEHPLGWEVKNDLRGGGWRFSPDQVQYRNTMLIDLAPEQEQLLMNMKSKTRYNIRLAGRKGVSVRVGDKDDLERLYQMYAKTSLRAGFTIREREYYQQLWTLFLSSEERAETDPEAVPLIAEVEGEPVAGAIIFRFGPRAYYLHGMSRTAHREKMPTYLIQWEAMLWAKKAGCSVYDMWGAPDTFSREDPMWGVYRFKRGFGGEVMRTLGAWDFPVRTLFDRVYTRIWPRVLDVLRQFGESRTEDDVRETG